MTRKEWTTAERAELLEKYRASIEENPDAKEMYDLLVQHVEAINSLPVTQETQLMLSIQVLFTQRLDTFVKMLYAGKRSAEAEDAMVETMGQYNLALCGYAAILDALLTARNERNKLN